MASRSDTVRFLYFQVVLLSPQAAAGFEQMLDEMKELAKALCGKVLYGPAAGVVQPQHRPSHFSHIFLTQVTENHQVQPPLIDGGRRR